MSLPTLSIKLRLSYYPIFFMTRALGIIELLKPCLDSNNHGASCCTNMPRGMYR